MCGAAPRRCTVQSLRNFALFVPSDSSSTSNFIIGIAFRVPVVWSEHPHAYRTRAAVRNGFWQETTWDEAPSRSFCEAASRYDSSTCRGIGGLWRQSAFGPLAIFTTELPKNAYGNVLKTELGDLLVNLQ